MERKVLYFTWKEKCYTLSIDSNKEENMANDQYRDADFDDVSVAIYLAVFMDNNNWSRIGEENGWLRVFLLQDWLKKRYPEMYARILNIKDQPLDKVEEERLNAIISQFPFLN